MKTRCLSRICQNLFALSLLLYLLSFSFQSYAQNEETKIAYIDQSRLRNEFMDYKKSSKELKDKWQKVMSTYQLDIQKSDSLYQSQSKIDSLASNDLAYEDERKALKDKHKKKLDKILQQRRSNMDTYEQKITKSVEAIVLHGKFVEVRNKYNNTNVADGQDITDQILEKLNK